jgi:hypothetical protein
MAEESKIAPAGAWRDPKRLSDGTKDRQQPREPKGSDWEYQDWHRRLRQAYNVAAYAADVDLIEWRLRGGVFVPVALTEISRVPNRYQGGELVSLPDEYRAAVLERYNSRDLQGHSSRTVARALGIHAYIVLYREDCSEFWIYNLTRGTGWVHLNPEAMVDFVREM